MIKITTMNQVNTKSKTLITRMTVWIRAITTRIKKKIKNDKIVKQKTYRCRKNNVDTIEENNYLKENIE